MIPLPRQRAASPVRRARQSSRLTMSTRSTTKPAPQGQMGGGEQAPEQPQQSGGSTAPQQGGSTPPVRYTDWASI